MRKLWIALGIVVVLLAGAVVVAAINLDRWVNENRDAVAAEAAKTLGREIEFGEIGISFWGGLAVTLADLRVGDDPAFSKEDFLTTDAVDVRVKILPALTGNIEISRIVLREPSITVIQTEKGLSTDSLGGAGGPEGKSGESGPPPALLVSLVDIRNGTLRWLDRTVKPPVDVGVAMLDFTASDVSFTDPVDFEMTAALFGAKSRNATVSGTVGPLESDAPRADLRLRLDPVALDDALRLTPVAGSLPEGLTATGRARVEANVAGTLAKLAFDARIDASDAHVKMGESFDKPAGRPLELVLAGEKTGDDVALSTMNLTVDRTKLTGSATVKDLESPKVDFSVSTASLELAAFGAAEPGADDVLRDVKLSGKATLPDKGPQVTAALRSPSGTVGGTDYQNLVLDVRMANERVEIRKLTANAYDGEVSVTGTYDMRKTPSFDVKTQVTGMRVEKVTESPTLTGELGANLDLAGRGSDWEQIKPALTGNGNVAIRNGVLKDFNPAGETMRALLSVPVLAGSGIGGFVKRHPKVFGVGDTPFEELAGVITVRDGWVDARGFELDVEDYVVTGDGRYSLDNQLDFGSVLRLSDALSEEILVAEPRLRYLRGPDGRVEFPVAFRGSPPKVTAYPDVTRIAAGAAREAVGDLLRGALGAKKPDAEKAPTSTGDAGTGDPGAGDPGAGDPPADAAEAPKPVTGEDLGNELLRRGIGELLGGGKKED